MILTKEPNKEDFNSSIIYSNTKVKDMDKIDVSAYDEKYKSLIEANEVNKKLLESFLIRLKLIDIVNQNWS